MKTQEIRKWTYKDEAWSQTTNQNDLIVFLNKQGDLGWELVYIDKPNQDWGFKQYMYLIFKKEVI